MEDQKPSRDDGISSGLRKVRRKRGKDPQDKLEEAKADRERAETEAIRESTEARRSARKQNTWLVPTVIVVCLFVFLLSALLAALGVFDVIHLSSFKVSIIVSGLLGSTAGIIIAFLKRPIS